MNRSHVLLSVCVMALVSVTSIAQADPPPDYELKFQQLPMIATPIPTPDGTTDIYYGHDELSTAWNYLPPDPNGQPPLYIGTYMADDFADRDRRPVFHLRWWGSYMATPTPEFMGVQQFLIAWETDVPADDPSNTVTYSHPGELIQAEVVTRIDLPAPGGPPPAGMFTEMFVPGSSVTEPVYVYNAELACPFPQEPDTVYWLKIVALDDVPRDGFFAWGWHNRDYTVPNGFASVPPAVGPGEYIDGILPGGAPIHHFQDDAVTQEVFVTPYAPCDVAVSQPYYWIPTTYIDGVDGPYPIGSFSKDLAFELYTIPEPATLALLGIGSLMMLRRRS